MRFALVALAVGYSGAPAAQADAGAVAIDWVQQNTQDLGLTGADVNGMVASSTSASTDIEKTHVYLRQTTRASASTEDCSP